jgi:magnesium-transporting ATPase (P-type)
MTAAKMVINTRKFNNSSNHSFSWYYKSCQESLHNICNYWGYMVQLFISDVILYMWTALIVWFYKLELAIFKGGGESATHLKSSRWEQCCPRAFSPISVMLTHLIWTTWTNTSSQHCTTKNLRHVVLIHELICPWTGEVNKFSCWNHN